MKKYLLIVAVLLLGFTLPRGVTAQSTLTFQLNLFEEIGSGEFDPSTDTALLYGNRSPLSLESGVTMTEGSMVDSIYTATVQFSESLVGQDLTFKFGIVTPDSSVKEDLERPRKTTLSKGERELNEAYFNIPPW